MFGWLGMDKQNAESDESFREVQESFDRLTSAWLRLQDFIVALDELDIAEIKALMDKYEIKIIRHNTQEGT